MIRVLRALTLSDIGAALCWTVFAAALVLTGAML